MDNILYSKKPPEAQLEEVDEIIRGCNSPARNVWQRIRSYIKNFESKLDEEHEILITFLTLKGAQAIEVNNISYWSPDMLIFECNDDDGETILLQHYSQVNFYLSARKKKNPKRPSRTIGFSSDTPNGKTNYDN